ncbi:MAG: heavy-metal-associated domain-containing protein, partial [Acidobacteria bacterium]|nr:heavy-metal-associated domain-containing protein [Acidobacteriota bacterium]
MKAEFQIKGMHCGSCAADIKETLEELAGVGRADVTFDGGTVFIAFDDETI